MKSPSQKKWPAAIDVILAMRSGCHSYSQIQMYLMDHKYETKTGLTRWGPQQVWQIVQIHGQGLRK